MLVIKSKPVSKEILDKSGEEYKLFLGDLDTYSDQNLKKIKAMTFMIMQVGRFTRQEQSALVGHINHMLKGRHK